MNENYNGYENNNDYTSYQEVTNFVEPKLGFNFGAFTMPLQFAFANKAWLCLVVLVPFISFFWAIISGIFGAKWAYSSGCYNTIEEFNAAMSSWQRAGIFVFFASIAILVIAVLISASLIGLVSSSLNYSV